jgi:hypothetical protein
MRAKRKGISLFGQAANISGYRQQLTWLLRQLHIVLMPAEWLSLVDKINQRGVTRTYISANRYAMHGRDEILPGWFVDTSHSRTLIFELTHKMQDMFLLEEGDIDFIWDRPIENKPIA